MLFTRRSTAVAVSVGLLSVVVFGYAMRARTYGEPPPKLTSTVPGFEVERLTFREWGCEPSQISREAGPFVLVIQNQSGLEDIDLSLVEESNNPRKKLPVTRNALTWKERLELPPGTYLVKEAGHPEWQCRITISNRESK
ncbi:MAG TPA: hypothetical protein VHQ94_21360 [Pyrinomonadaceae bacterium]|nr:hypothetical protein [Pyrinomonadaceae bacterium]